MSKYTPLGEFLRAQAKAEVPMSFGEIERVIGAALPPRAQEQRAWWSNNPDNNVMTKVWLEAGFVSERVDIGARRLVFRRSTDRARPKWVPGDPIPLINGRHPIFGALKGLMVVREGVDLTEPADPTWADIVDGKTI